jgi:hypothetical protein
MSTINANTSATASAPAAYARVRGEEVREVAPPLTTGTDCHVGTGNLRIVALKKFVERLTKPTDEVDRERLTTWCDTQGGEPLDAVSPRRPVFIAGEVRSVRIVPRAGADALEATVNDGRSSLTAVFLGRRRVGGLTPGRRVTMQGVVTLEGRDRYMFNPVYTLQ